jgi:DNA-binding MarR family transcriptional regulator
MGPAPDADDVAFDVIHWGREQWEMRHGHDGAFSMETVSSLVRVRELIVDFMEQQLASVDMNFAEYDILCVIEVSGSPPLGRIKETSRRYFSHQTSVTNIVSRLAKRGYLSLRRDDADGRMTRVDLTRLGSTRLRKAHTMLASMEFGLAGFSDDDKRALNDLLFKIRANHGDAGPDAGGRSTEQ